MKILLILLFLIFGSAFAKTEKKPVCDLCVEIEKISLSFDEDEIKAYKKFNKFMSVVELSAKKETRKQEMASIVKAVVLFGNRDSSMEVHEYLADLASKYPREFKLAMKELGAYDRKILQAAIDRINRMNQKGGEGD